MRLWNDISAGSENDFVILVIIIVVCLILININNNIIINILDDIDITINTIGALLLLQKL